MKVQRDDWKALHARAAAAALQGWQFSWQEFRWAADCARRVRSPLFLQLRLGLPLLQPLER